MYSMLIAVWALTAINLQPNWNLSQWHRRWSSSHCDSTKRCQKHSTVFQTVHESDRQTEPSQRWSTTSLWHSLQQADIILYIAQRYTNLMNWLM